MRIDDQDKLIKAGFSIIRKRLSEPEDKDVYRHKRWLEDI